MGEHGFSGGYFLLMADDFRALPDIASLRSIFVYSAETGEIVWKWREFATQHETRRWNTRYAGKPAGSPDEDSGLTIKIKKRLYKAHRIAWALFYGEDAPSHLVIDHRNGNALDNRIDNLRLATRSQNAHNSSSRRSGMPKGVYRRGSKFFATICVDGKQMNLGTYGTLVEAVEARAKADNAYCGEFARAR